MLVTISPCFSYCDMLTVAKQGEQEKLLPGEPARPRLWLGAAGPAPPRRLSLARRPAAQGDDASHRSAPLSLIFYYKYIPMDWFYGDRVSNFPQPKLPTSWLTLLSLLPSPHPPHPPYHHHKHSLNENFKSQYLSPGSSKSNLIATKG